MFYSEEIIEEVRQRNPIVDVIGGYVHLTKKGGNYFGLCPFHNEKSPSFSVSPSKQMYHCFGCGVGGNVLTFVMEYENYSFPEAMEMLAKRAGIELPKQEFTPEMKREADERSVLLQMHKDTAIFYCGLLRSEQGKPGMDYFNKRQVSPEMIRAFGLGYAGQHPETLYRYLKKKGYTDEQIKASGLVTIYERGARDRFWNRVIYPIMDVNNRVIAFGGRVLGDGEPKYMNSPETKIFDKSRNLYGLNVARRTREKYFLVCEGYMDVIAMHQAGFTNAVASLGTAFTSQHGMIIKRYTDEAVLCYDMDGAGRKAALRAIPILRESGLRLKVLNMQPCKDPDEFIKTYGEEEFRKRIESAENAFMFVIDTMRQQYDFKDPEEKSLFFNEAAKKLAELSDEIERNAYIEAVANRYGVDYAVLRGKVNVIGNSVVRTSSSDDDEPVRPKSGSARRQKDSSLTTAEKLVLTSLVQTPEYYKKISEYVSPGDFSDPLMQQVATELYGQLAGGNGVNPAAIINHFIDSEQYQEVAAMFSSDYTDAMNEEDRRIALNEAVAKLRESSLERKMEATMDPTVLMDCLRQKQELMRNRIIL